MIALELFRGRTIDIATTHGVMPVDGLANGAFHIRPQVHNGVIVYSVSHIPTGMKIPARISELSAAAELVVDLLALDIDWAEATVDLIRSQGKVIVPVVRKRHTHYVGLREIAPVIFLLCTVLLVLPMISDARAARRRERSDREDA